MSDDKKRVKPDWFPKKDDKTIKKSEESSPLGYPRKKEEYERRGSGAGEKPKKEKE